jgi:hypothetical protein
MTGKLTNSLLLAVCKRYAGSVHAGFTTAVYAAGAGMKANGDYGLATYPWDLSAKTNPAPTTQKTSLLELFSKGADNYICGCGIATAPAATRRMLQ